MSALNAQMSKERSPIHAKQFGAVYARLGDTVLVSRYSGVNDPERHLRCGLADLNNLPRVGFRGAATAEYLQQRGYQLPATPNQAIVQTDGGLVARLSQAEYLLLGSLNDSGYRTQLEEQNWSLGPQAVYLLPRQDSHAWLLLTGTHTAQVMAKLCGVDLRAEAFPEGTVAQTSAARINVIVINAPVDGVPAFHILCDRASCDYFWDVLLDAMAEFDGGPVGIEALLER